MRQTIQKKLILEKIKKFPTFFNAEELYHELKNSKVSLATIYRFLKNMTDSGKIHSYQCKGKKIYSINQDNHCHFTCKICGKTEHIKIKNLDFIPLKLKVCHFQLDLCGLCQKCQSKT